MDLSLPALDRAPLVAAVIASALFAACAGGLPKPTEADASWARRHWQQASVQSLAAGESLYVQRCAGCHNLKLPSQFAPAQWQAAMDDMRESHDVVLPSEEEQLIVQYVVTMSVRANPAETAYVPAQR